MYNIIIVNGTKTLEFTEKGEKTSLTICNATEAKNASIVAVYKEKSGNISSTDFKKENKPTTTPSTTGGTPTGNYFHCHYLRYQTSELTKKKTKKLFIVFTPI